MTAIAGGFVGVLLVLELVDRLTDMGSVLLGVDATFVKVNIALLSAMSFTAARQWGTVPRGVTILILLSIAVLDAVWAAYVAHRRRHQGREKSGPP
jgi:hypothetical protein